MSLREIQGNEKVIERLCQSLNSGNISHAYIFEGDAGIDKFSLAENFVKALLCSGESDDSCEVCPSCNKINHGNHEDVILLKAEGSSIKDESIEELQSRLKKKPYVGDRTIVIMQDADTMTVRAQNRLLKTLEEPFPGTVMILLSDNLENLAQTILSRCVIYKLKPYDSPNYEDIMEATAEVGELLLKNKPFYIVSKKVMEMSSTREAAAVFLDLLERWFRDLALCKYDRNIVTLSQLKEDLLKKSRLYPETDIHKAIACIEEAKNDLNRNFNISYTLKSMILKISA
ncbi:ATP-binding protein [Sinanaerobacter chloroacetimidivorans]|jgi:DNA polymerase-3 subunit delta'|uniref:DNA-directed DNA polymerase n=1 Tax=Sinanaerobacter chloroacetimidivorans TaxID=2818044 RepID=A0A8J7W767_9FIRM|nr:hypothetical protein [Sinanaerobacter chloroacetimidivorans]MBR0600568.1 hypothetical protein [Sinanaerobacter chloroacetimidivorans]